MNIKKFITLSFFGLFFILNIQNVLAAPKLRLDVSYTKEESVLFLNIKEPKGLSRNLESEKIISISMDIRYNSSIDYVGAKGLSAVKGVNVKDDEGKLSLLVIDLNDISSFKNDGVNLRFKINNDKNIVINPIGTFATINSKDKVNIEFNPKEILIGDNTSSIVPVEIDEDILPIEDVDLETSEPGIDPSTYSNDVMQNNLMQDDIVKENKPLPSSGSSSYLILLMAFLVFAVSRLALSKR